MIKYGAVPWVYLGHVVLASYLVPVGTDLTRGTTTRTLFWKGPSYPSRLGGIQPEQTRLICGIMEYCIHMYLSCNLSPSLV